MATLLLRLLPLLKPKHLKHLHQRRLLLWRLHFAVGKADLATGADEALKDVIAGVKEGKKALVSGYHDSTGTLAVNEEVAKKRAFAVKEALVRLGVTEDQIELVKPQVSEGTGANAEARRVEVVLK